MKILAINGSHRGKKGYTQFLIDTFFKGAQKSGAQCHTIVLKDQHIKTCLACRVCHKKEHYLRCIYDDKDDVKTIFHQMREADILIFATPIYIFQMTGLMKIFLDRITSTCDSSILAMSKNGLFFHHIDQQLLAKPFVLITTQDNLENETSQNVHDYFNTFSRFLDAPFLAHIRRKSGALVGHGKNKAQEKQYPQISTIYRFIEKAGNELARNQKIKKSTLKQCNQSIINMPLFIKIMLKFKWLRQNKTFMSKVLHNARRQIEQHKQHET